MKREQFLSEIMESILFPYESSRVYEEQIIGEFENEFELKYFHEFFKVWRKRILFQIWHVVMADIPYNSLKGPIMS